MVIAVPAYFSNCERQAFLDAAEIAGIRCPRLINDSTALALTYEYQKKNELSAGQQRIVAFVDFGHSKTCITIASFMQGRIKIIRQHSDRNLGARNMDMLLFEVFAKEFEQKFGLSLNDNFRAKLKMFDAIERLRTRLTANKVAEIEIEALMDDHDFKKTITREEFEAMIQPVVLTLANRLDEAVKFASMQPSNLHVIELIGDATRIPAVISTVQTVYQKECSRTMNSQDSIAKGCAIQAAMLSRFASKQSAVVEDFNQIPIMISYQFEGSKVVTKELFPVGSSFPSTKSITFQQKDGGLSLLIHYHDKFQLLEGLPN